MFLEDYSEHVSASALCHKIQCLVLNPTAHVLTTSLQNVNGLKKAESSGTIYVQQWITGLVKRLK